MVIQIMLKMETVESVYAALTTEHGVTIFSKLPTELGVYPLEQLDYWSAGDGNEMGVRFKLTDPEVPFIHRYFEMTGTYSSWDASRWDGQFVEVVPIIQQVTFYARKAGYR